MGIFNKQLSKTTQPARLAGALLLILIVLVQAGMILHFGEQKVGFHEDEMATYELSNLPGGFLHLTDGFLETWVPGDFFQYPLTADQQRAFDYSIPYHNQENDVHPPFYYYVIHTASSCFPGTFSKWIGIIPNLLFCMLATVLLFFLSQRLWGSSTLALITAAAWAWSVGAMSTAVFIRMYAMLTVCCLLLVLAHLRALEEAQKGNLRGRTLLMLLACTFLGILTQYYFLVFCFFLCGLFFLYLALTKRWAFLLKYTAAEFGAIGLSVLYFPQMLYHIFSGYRGKQALENAVSSGQYLSHIRSVASIISKQLFNGWIVELILLLAAAAAVYGVKRFFFRRRSQTSGQWPFSLRQTLLVAAAGLVAAGYILVIVKVAPYQVDRYYMCVYPLIILVVVHALWAAAGCFIRKRQVLFPLVALCFLVITGLSYQRQSVNYLYPEYAQRAQALAPYQGASVIVLNGDYAWAPDHWLTEYRQYDEVYRCDLWDFSSLDSARDSRDLSDGFLLYAVWPETTTQERLFEVIGEHLPVKDYQLVTDIGCRVYYITLEEE